MSVQITSFETNICSSSQLLKCLADKNRLQIFAILTHGQTRVSDIYKCLELKQNLISHHLKVLKNHKLVQTKRTGREIYYSLNSETMNELKVTFKNIFRPYSVS